MTGELYSNGSLSLVESVVAVYRKGQVAQEIAVADGGMDNPTPAQVQRYMSDGRNALQLTLNAMLTTGTGIPERILDFPSGYGRVARHYRAAFPQSAIVACDINESMMNFCEKYFACVPKFSNGSFADLVFDELFDLAWCGSLLTHLPRTTFAEAIGLLSRSLKPNGIALFTTHGRYSTSYGDGVYLSRDRFAAVKSAYEDVGFGYGDYRDDDTWEKGNYGISLSSPSFVASLLEADTSVQIVSFTERGWNNHQDVWVIQKRPVLVAS